MEVVSQEDATYKKYESFWGLCAYAINKKGARKLTNELDNKPITMQIDSKMSHLIIQDKLNVYGYKEKLVWHGRNQGTDIQMPVKPQPDINPFILEDL
jgi:GR25 family glycosyltransferase involved in LPS biosynthesis